MRPDPATDGDPHHLQRFVEAQDGVYEQVRAELRAGDKRSHWMWFIFPQLRSLGRSGTARFYGIADAAEALAYWRHPVLGPRLAECCALMLAVPERSALQILHAPDDLKFRSCLTLFAQAAPQAIVFREALERFYGGEPDALTLNGI